MWLVRLALKNPYAVSVAALMILVAGLVALIRIPVDILPAFKSPGVLVLTFYNGMPASAIDRNITTRMERWCGQATGVVKVESKSMVGVSIVRLYFRDDIDPAAALTEVNSLALGTLKTLPPGTLPPIVRPFDPTATLPLCILSVRSPDGRLSEAQLQDLARVDLRNQLGGLPGVVAPVAFGGRERAVMVYVRPEDMEARQISPLDVVRALRDYNQMLAGGTAKFGDEEVQLDSNAVVLDVEDFNDIPIKIVDDKQVFLKDIGEARDASRIQTALVRIDGRPQVYVPIYRQQGASSLAVVNSVQNELPLMKARSPDGVELDVVMDQSIYVRQAIKALVEEGVLGALLAAGMILIFLGSFRSTLIAALSIPLAVLAAIAALLATDNTINAMTLGGLALAVGPLVDNAIVVLENTHRHLGMGKGPVQAALDGAAEVAQPALVATLSTILVLVPLAFMPGMGKFLFRPLALAVAFAMLASLFLALTFVPVRCAAWLRSHHAHPEDNGRLAGRFQRFHHRVERALHRLTNRYSRALRWALAHRLLTLASVGLLFLVALALLTGIGREFFPQIDSGQLTIYYRCPTGTKIEKTNERLARFEQFLKEEIAPGDLRMIVSEVGTTTNWSAAYTPNSGPQDAVIKVQLTDNRSKTAQEYASLLRRKFAERQQGDPEFADLRISFDTGGMISAALNYGATSPIEIQVVGGSLAEAREKAREVRDLVRTIPGTADVRILQRNDYPQMIIEIDRKKAQRLGLDVPEVLQTVTTALNSSVVVDRNFWLDPKTGNQYWIGVQYEEEKLHTNLEMVKNISLNSRNSSEVVKLGTVVQFRRQDQAPAELTHDNLANVVSVMVNLDGRDIGSVAADIQSKLKDIELPRGMVLRMTGEYQRMNESFGNLGFGLLLASVLVYLLMVAQFRSYLSPLIIMFAVPLGLIGVLITLFVTRTTLNVQSCMGVIFMVGIVVANSTLLIDFANRQRALGASVYQAITTAAAIRLRPILMTFLATFLDLLPMAIGLGKGSEANVPLARAVVGGLLASTVLTLFVVPVLYTLFNRDAPERESPAPIPAAGRLVAVG
ncbi:MAG TPA: efflux RND transporter permease subunit [Gemmataceae bacterium]|nr:efflux RND transporter permease subunit [Gemmataceae bacterium]